MAKHSTFSLCLYSLRLPYAVHVYSLMLSFSSMFTATNYSLKKKANLIPRGGSGKDKGKSTKGKDKAGELHTCFCCGDNN